MTEEKQKRLAEALEKFRNSTPGTAEEDRTWNELMDLLFEGAT